MAFNTHFTCFWFKYRLGIDITFVNYYFKNKICRISIWCRTTFNLKYQCRTFLSE